MNIKDKDDDLLLLRLLPKSFEHFKDTFIYGKEYTITLDEARTLVRS